MRSPPLPAGLPAAGTGQATSLRQIFGVFRPTRLSLAGLPVTATSSSVALRPLYYASCWSDPFM
jgi:hypothetical protein